MFSSYFFTLCKASNNTINSFAYLPQALFIVQGLQNEVKVVKEDNHKKVTLLRTQVKEKEDQFEMVGLKFILKGTFQILLLTLLTM